MKLPEIFSGYLEALSLDGKEGFTHLVRVAEPTRTNAEPSMVQGVDLYISSQYVGEITLKGFTKKIKELLESKNHITEDEIVYLITACVVYASVRADRLAVFQRVVESIENFTTSHFIFGWEMAEEQKWRAHGYSFGNLNSQVLQSRCRRAGSDFFDRYNLHTNNRFCIESREFTRRRIDFSRLFFQLYVSNASFEHLVLLYNESLSAIHIEDMWDDLDRTQLVSSVFNKNIFDVESYKASDYGKNFMAVTVYLNKSKDKEGYVVPNAKRHLSLLMIPTTNLIEQHIIFSDEFGISDCEKSEFGRTINTFSEFIRQAIRFSNHMRYDDALLYCMIAFETVFSEKNHATEKTCARVAALTHLRIYGGKPYTEANAELKKLYEVRSGFVHRGESCDSLLAEKVIEYAKEVLKSMLYLYHKEESRDTGAVDQWVKDLEIIIASYNANREVDRKTLLSMGIFDQSFFFSKGLQILGDRGSP
jgi:hypothetical protein